MPRAPSRDVSFDGRTAFFAALAVTVAVYLVPFGSVVGRPLVWLATMVHELGHGVAALATGGEFIEFLLFTDGSGVAPTRTSGGVARAAVAAGGLLGPSLAAALGFWLARGSRRARVALVSVAFLLSLALLVKAGNALAMIMLGGTAAICAMVGLRASGRWAQLTLMLLSLQLALSLWSDLGYMFSPTAELETGGMPSDSANIADTLGGPYWLWGGVCAAVSALTVGFGAWVATRRKTP